MSTQKLKLYKQSDILNISNENYQLLRRVATKLYNQKFIKEIFNIEYEDFLGDFILGIYKELGNNEKRKGGKLWIKLEWIPSNLGYKKQKYFSDFSDILINNIESKQSKNINENYWKKEFIKLAKEEDIYDKSTKNIRESRKQGKGDRKNRKLKENGSHETFNFTMREKKKLKKNKKIIKFIEEKIL